MKPTEAPPLKVVVPEDIKPGAYVVSWRWDCEETAQVFFQRIAIKP